jgi:DNA mismatch repair protein MutH
MIAAPTTIAQLEHRAEQLAGLTMTDLSSLHQVELPNDLRKDKGWQGQFIERCLGADGGNLAQPDFSFIGVELKTLPIDYSGQVQESTYVSVLDINKTLGIPWSDSVVCKKLQHVLWVPIARQKGQPLALSTIATPFFWQPSTSQNKQLRSDWENAMELVSLGKIHQLNARMGQILQVRPKAANSRVVTQTTDEQGNQAHTLPRGFYLRPQFTQQLLANSLKL